MNEKMTYFSQKSQKIWKLHLDIHGTVALPPPRMLLLFILEFTLIALLLK